MTLYQIRAAEHLLSGTTSLRSAKRQGVSLSAIDSAIKQTLIKYNVGSTALALLALLDDGIVERYKTWYRLSTDCQVALDSRRAVRAHSKVLRPS